jgi:carbonic anhydrase
MGPYEWPYMYSECSGTSQSPIDLNPSSAVYNSALKSIQFNNYNVPYDMNMYYNGHVIVIAPYANNGVLPSIQGSNFDESFSFAQVHFHWGYSDHQGSEHQWKGEMLPLEAHFVHKSATGKLTVLGFFFQVNFDPILVVLV